MFFINLARCDLGTVPSTIWHKKICYIWSDDHQVLCTLYWIYDLFDTLAISSIPSLVCLCISSIPSLACLPLYLIFSFHTTTIYLVVSLGHICLSVVSVSLSIFLLQSITLSMYLSLPLFLSHSIVRHEVSFPNNCFKNVESLYYMVTQKETIEFVISISSNALNYEITEIAPYVRTYFSVTI